MTLHFFFVTHGWCNPRPMKRTEIILCWRIYRFWYV